MDQKGQLLAWIEQRETFDFVDRQYKRILRQRSVADLEWRIHPKPLFFWLGAEAERV